MAMATGNADCTAGLSKRIYDYLIGDAGNGFSGSMTAAQTATVKALCYAVSRAVVDEVVANAVCTVVAQTDDFGTGIPAAPVTKTGTVA